MQIAPFSVRIIRPAPPPAAVTARRMALWKVTRPLVSGAIVLRWPPGAACSPTWVQTGDTADTDLAMPARLCAGRSPLKPDRPGQKAGPLGTGPRAR